MCGIGFELVVRFSVSSVCFMPYRSFLSCTFPVPDIEYTNGPSRLLQMFRMVALALTKMLPALPI